MKLIQKTRNSFVCASTLCLLFGGLVRPAFGQAQQTIGMFVLTPDGSEAVRTSVKLGRNSVSTIEIIEGLKEGDQVIISDTSALDSYNRIRVR